MRYAPSALTATVVALFFAAGAWGADDAATRSSEKLGRVLFKTSCSPEAQKQFERALAMQHSFFFPETIKTFSAFPQTDPSCAISYWGIAISQRPNPLVGPFDSAALKRGLDAVEKGKAIGAKTQRERDWLAAIEAFYKDYEKVDQDTRTQNYAKAMEALAQKYPDDVEAKIFYALALNETFDHKNMEPLLKAINILEPLDKKYPDHPGIAHYLIHSFDFPPLAKRGVATANKYAKIAPSAPHAQHMPSHIYTMVGMWDASIASNQKAIVVANDYVLKANLDGTLAGVPHAYDFMAYAYLQLGQDARARGLIDETAGIKKVMGRRAAVEEAGGMHVLMQNGLYPMRELLGDMLMAQDQATAALTEYETSLQIAPMRLRGFYGAAKAADAVGDTKKATEYFTKLRHLTKDADGHRPELREARARATKQ